ncbi:DNA-binding MarR family transcriptional regulator [Mesorhizobium soli]|jgi:DNA-binding MarR family transcriptional regulator|uniref:MarR family transcriptional regulator n=1 Tax=Pseudaminobacter soli (ex Li et al. 2025) TaxID=1295366 RepID=UPI002473ABD6|nr:MarR family transcriptional regulator [Mesorhizobium soli]MDH6230873.1 DNA-binding MarR family transcriptional regulator [Mesorhizobium soli]
MQAITQAVMAWQDATQAFDDAVGERAGLNAAERRALALLQRGPQTAGAVAAATALTPAAVTSLIDRLEARGLVKRTRSAEDRRKVMVEAGEAARELGLKYYGPIAQAGWEMLDGYSDAELAIVERFVTDALALQQRELARLTGG